MHSSDFADVFIVGLLLFLLLKILQQNVHRRVLFVFVSLAVMYWAARTYHWELTLKFVHVISMAVGIGFILVFQEDVRRFFESYVFQSMGWKKNSREYPQVIQILLEAVETFSKQQIGALIVLQQKIPVGHLVRGGHRLNGDVSLPLLCSLFDPHSPGHDGAVILEDSKAVRFGVHLPLSRKIASSGRSGTRHAAALGLSEVCDSVILVVSEETGDISIAEQGVLKKVTLAQVEARLGSLRRAEPVSRRSNRVLNFFRANWMLQTACTAGAFFLWLGFAAPRNLQQRTFALAVTLEDVPKEFLLDEPMPTECKVTLMGPQDTFERWEKQNQIIRLPVGHLKPGTERITLSGSNLSMPSGIFVRQFEPSVVSLRTHKTRTVTVPVVVNSNGRMPTSLQGRVKIAPPDVKLLVRDGDPGPSMVMTEALAFTNVRRGSSVDLKLIPPAKTQFSDQSSSSVKVTFE